MKRTRNFLCVLGIGVASLLATNLASAQPSSQDQSAQPAQSAKMAKKKTETATVVKVDTQKRHLTLRDDQGKEFTMQVPEEVQRLGEIRKGDRIKVDYYESVGISLLKSAGGEQPRGSETTIVERNAGKLPSGKVAHAITATVEVVNVDRSNNTVTVKKPNGELDTIDVTDPAMQSELSNLHPGDKIQATYTEAAAISVQREGKSNKPS